MWRFLQKTSRHYSPAVRNQKPSFLFFTLNEWWPFTWSILHTLPLMFFFLLSLGKWQVICKDRHPSAPSLLLQLDDWISISMLLLIQRCWRSGHKFLYISLSQYFSSETIYSLLKEDVSLRNYIEKKTEGLCSSYVVERKANREADSLGLLLVWLLGSFTWMRLLSLFFA